MKLNLSLTQNKKEILLPLNSILPNVSPIHIIILSLGARTNISFFSPFLSWDRQSKSKEAAKDETSLP
jgi:hypothetical protein